MILVVSEKNGLVFSAGEKGGQTDDKVTRVVLGRGGGVGCCG